MKNNPHEYFFKLLQKIPGAERESIIWQYSGMSTTSLREFLEKKPEDYKHMIAELQLKVNKATGNYWLVDPEIKRLRSSILHRLQKHGVDTTSWTCVNLFLQQPRIAGKRLYEMTVPEMRSLIKKLESILRKDQEKQEEEHRLINNN